VNKEEWRSVVGYEGYYEVSSEGRVRRIAPDTMGRTMMLGKTLSHSIVAGYPRVGLSVNGRQKAILVHQLVAAAFIGPCPPGKEVNHRDGVKTHNSISNLEYVTRRENHRHAVVMHLHGVGSEKYNARVSERDVFIMRHLREFGVGYTELAKMYQLSLWPTMAICYGRSWKHVGGPIDKGGYYPLSRMRHGKLRAIGYEKPTTRAGRANKSI
jgi:hypothetical protein